MATKRGTKPHGHMGTLPIAVGSTYRMYPTRPHEESPGRRYQSNGTLGNFCVGKNGISSETYQPPGPVRVNNSAFLTCQVVKQQTSSHVQLTDFNNLTQRNKLEWAPPKMRRTSRFPFFSSVVRLEKFSAHNIETPRSRRRRRRQTSRQGRCR